MYLRLFESHTQSVARYFSCLKRNGRTYTSYYTPAIHRNIQQKADILFCYCTVIECLRKRKYLGYYRSRIKCPLFVPKTRTPRVTSKSPHTILKKQKIWGTFLFLIFTMVWGQFLTMPHTRLSWILGMKSRHFILLR